eukprot:1642601-Rhodomonas_salina.11
MEVCPAMWYAKGVYGGVRFRVSSTEIVFGGVRSASGTEVAYGGTQCAVPRQRWWYALRQCPAGRVGESRELGRLKLSVCSYTFPMPCPAMSGTDLVYRPTLSLGPCPALLWPIVLRFRCAIFGTDLAYRPTLPLCDARYSFGHAATRGISSQWEVSCAICLRFRRALPGTDDAYAATRRESFSASFESV